MDPLTNNNEFKYVLPRAHHLALHYFAEFATKSK